MLKCLFLENYATWSFLLYVQVLCCLLVIMYAPLHLVIYFPFDMPLMQLNLIAHKKAVLNWFRLYLSKKSLNWSFHVHCAGIWSTGSAFDSVIIIQIFFN